MEWCFPSLLYQNCRGTGLLSRNDVSYRRSLEISIIIITPFLLSKNSTIFGFILETWFKSSLFFVDLKLILLTNLHVEFYKFRRSYHHFPSLGFIFFVYFFMVAFKQTPVLYWLVLKQYQRIHRLENYQNIWKAIHVRFCNNCNQICFLLDSHWFWFLLLVKRNLFPYL